MFELLSLLFLYFFYFWLPQCKPSPRCSRVKCWFPWQQCGQCRPPPSSSLLWPRPFLSRTVRRREARSVSVSMFGASDKEKPTSRLADAHLTDPRPVSLLQVIQIAPMPVVQSQLPQGGAVHPASPFPGSLGTAAVMASGSTPSQTVLLPPAPTRWETLRMHAQTHV